MLERIGSDYGVPVLDPPIPKSIRFAEAPALGRSVLSTAHRSKGATAYRDVGGDVAGRPSLSDPLISPADQSIPSTATDCG